MDKVKIRRANITQEDFDQCIDEMLANDIKPTVTAVFRQIGGSFTTISPMFDEWKAERNKSSGSKVAIPDFVQKASEQMGRQWWELVQADVAEKIQRIEADTQQRLSELQLERDEFLASTKQLESVLEGQTKAHQDAVDALKQSHAESMAKLQSELTDHKTLLAASEERLSSTKQTLSEKDKDLARLEKEAKEKQGSYDDLQDQYQALVKSSRAERSQIKAEAEKEINVLRTQFQRQIKDEKATAENEKNQMEAAAKKVESSMQALLDEKNILLAEKEQRLSDLERLLTALEKTQKRVTTAKTTSK